MTSPVTLTHAQYLLLLRVADVDKGVIDARARAISAAYMQEFGARGALTAAVLRLGTAIREGTSASGVPSWNFAIHYFGPVDSVAWLERRLQDEAQRLGTTIETQTLTAEIITGQY